MSFLSPIWLISIAAVSIPVFIHLWNVRPGKTLKVGSIALIETASRRRSRSFNLLDVLLLILRCLLLILLALVLAMPFIQKQVVAGNIKGWLLLPHEDFKEAYQHFKPTADSLLKAGYELHYFDADFQKVPLTQALTDSVTYKSSNAVTYWNLLQQLGKTVPGSLPVYLITPDFLNKFNGAKPDIALKLNWQTYTPTDSIFTRIQRAWFTDAKDIRVLIGTSKPSGTYYHTENINPEASKSSTFDITVINGKASIALKSNNQKPVEIDSSSLKIDVFAATNQQDTGYVKAALQTIGQFTQQNIVIKPYNPNNESVKKDWLFWLSDQPVNKKVFEQYNNVLLYENGKASVTNGKIITDDAGQQVVSLYRSISTKTYSGESIWLDGFGKPILTSELTGKARLYHFYNRFNPAWNDLVWNADFPKIMLQLILPADEYRDDPLFDKRTVDAKQVQPDFISQKDNIQSNDKLSSDLTHYFWLFLMLIFFAERWLAHKNQLEK